MISIFLAFIAIFPQYAFLALLFIIALENNPKPFEIKNDHKFIYFHFVLFGIYLFNSIILLKEFLFPLIITGTYGLSLIHELYHKKGVFKNFYIMKDHKDHHLGIDLKDKEMRISPFYPIFKSFNILVKSPFLTALIVVLSILVGYNILLFHMLSLIIIYTIGYMQHDIKNNPVDFTNWTVDLLGYNSGQHCKHHRIKKQTEDVNTGIYTGLLVSFCWIIIALVLQFLSIFLKSVTMEPIYNQGFIKNAKIYLYHNKAIVLLYRWSSVFEKPSLIIHYLKIASKKDNNKYKYSHTVDLLKNPETIVNPTHEVCKNRNIYLSNPGLAQELYENSNIVVTEGDNKELRINEGHHRFSAGLVRNLNIYIRV